MEHVQIVHACHLRSIQNLIWILAENNMPLESLYPKPMGNYCGADYAQGYVLDAQGNIYKCWSDVGVMEQRIGTAHDWNETNKNQQLVTYSHKACLKIYVV